MAYFNDFKEKLAAHGFYHAPGIVSAAHVSALITGLEKAIEDENQYHGHSEYATYGTVLNLAVFGPVFLSLLENELLMANVDAIVGENTTLYSYSSSSIPPLGKIHTARIHTDTARATTDHTLLLGAIVALSPFTINNGATWFLPASHMLEEKPTDEQFFAQAQQVTAQAGDVIYFDPMIWHAGGENKTTTWRHALTLGFCKPWIKQRFDMPRALEEKGLHTGLSETLLKRLGFYHRTPVNYTDFYTSKRISY